MRRGEMESDEGKVVSSGGGRCGGSSRPVMEPYGVYENMIYAATETSRFMEKQRLDSQRVDSRGSNVSILNVSILAWERIAVSILNVSILGR